MTAARTRRSAALLLAVVAHAACGSPTRPVPTLEIATTSLPPAVRGIEYLQPIYAEGGDGAYFWDVVAGSLPVGLTFGVDDLAVDHALITGVPENIETATFTVELRSGDGQTVTREFSLTVVPEGAPLAVRTLRVPPALAGGPYDVQLDATGGDGATYTWSLVGGTLPAGLQLSATGRLSGTPTTVQTTSFVVEVRSTAFTAQAQFELRVVAHAPQAFRITVYPVTDMPASLQPHIAAAVAEWEAAITGNLQALALPFDLFDPDDCAGFGPLANGTTVDDLLIMLSITSIDGPGGVLGRAGPCAARPDNLLPFVGMIALDADDLVPLVGTETLTDIIAHEIGHVLGFGTLWQLQGLIEGHGGADPRYTGQHGVAAYQALGGSGNVPLETLGGDGTRDSHWRKTVFNIELMTGFAEPVGIDQPISRVSIAQMQDLGYTVNLAAALPITLTPPALRADAHAFFHAHGDAFDEVYRGPIRLLHPDGSSTVIRPDR